MTYGEWFGAHEQKHRAITDKLRKQNMSKAQIIAYFDFENMCEKERDFCPLYATHTKCHDIPRLNCYLCACPYFRFNDDGIEQIEGATLYSVCDIYAKNGKSVRYGDAVHHDCSRCLVPHYTGTIKQILK